MLVYSCKNITIRCNLNIKIVKLKLLVVEIVMLLFVVYYCHSSSYEKEIFLKFIFLFKTHNRKKFKII